MKSFYLIALIACIFLAGCSSSKKRAKSEADASHAAAASPADSMLSDQLSQPTAKIAPAPGTARVTAEIVSVENSDASNGRCILKIVQVDAYGSNTPPLGEGAEIEATVTKSILDTYEDGVANFVIRYQQVPNLSGDKPPSWHITSIR